MLNQVRIVLVETSHPGNIGAAARAMKNMGLSELALVNPLLFPHTKATAMASSADDVLQRAQQFDSVIDAIRGCHVVIGASVRERTHDCVMLTPREAADLLRRDLSDRSAAILFGRERTGLTNQELEYCHYRLHIPANPAYCSLNIAQAVQVVCYELRMAIALAGQAASPRARVSAERMEEFYQHLETTLTDLEFLKPDKPGLLMRKLRRIFNRAELDEKECNLLRGVWSAAQGRKIQYLMHNQEKH